MQRLGGLAEDEAAAEAGQEELFGSELAADGAWEQAMEEATRMQAALQATSALMIPQRRNAMTDLLLSFTDEEFTIMRLAAARPPSSPLLFPAGCFTPQPSPEDPPSPLRL